MVSSREGKCFLRSEIFILTNPPFIRNDGKSALMLGGTLIDLCPISLFVRALPGSGWTGSRLDLLSGFFSAPWVISHFLKGLCFYLLAKLHWILHAGSAQLRRVAVI